MIKNKDTLFFLFTHFHNFRYYLRGHHEKATEIGEKLFLSSAVELIHINEHLFFEGWYDFRRYQDKGFSLTDCISFIVMRQKGLETALTFDKHFAQAGFQIEPQQF